MKIARLTPFLSVSPQLGEADLGVAAAQAETRQAFTFVPLINGCGRRAPGGPTGRGFLR